jgi:glycosyltransferase involved in cell wall biosynthesis
VPNGLDVAAYPFTLPAPAETPVLVFLGKLDFRPNADAMRWFLQTVLPGLGSTRCFVVGGAPPPWLVALGQHDARVAVTGHVPDERAYLRRGTALVLPVQTGGGSRLKALVAMASGLPIVSTRVGMEGLDVEPEEHFLRAETPADWIAALTRLQRDPALGQRLARAGRARVEARYDWSVVRAELLAAYAGLTA